MGGLRAEQVSDPVAEHGEGPVWAPNRGTLLLVDLEAGDLLELHADGAVTRRPIDRALAALRPRRAGGWIAAVERGFRLLDADLAPEGETIPAFEDPALRMNEGGCDPQGRFYCGSMAYAARDGAGTLYRLDPDRSVHTVLSGVTISNGLQWTPDGGSAYYIDTPTGRIDRFAFDAAAGLLRDRTPFARLADGQGSPDGMAIDVAGGIWVACWGGWAVRRFGPDGAPGEVVEVPVPNPTSCTFGGATGTTLYITTSRQGGGDAEAASGAVFAVQTGMRGGPVHAFAG